MRWMQRFRFVSKPEGNPEEFFTENCFYITGQYFEGFTLEGKESTLPVGVYSIDDLKEYGRSRNWCPYFLARYAVCDNHETFLVPWL